MRRTALLVMLVALAGCREGDGPADPGASSPLVMLRSSPNGATVSVDNRATDIRTPDTLRLRAGDRRILLRLDTAGFLYDFSAILRVERSDEVPEIELPLALRCGASSGGCIAAARRYHSTAGVRFAASGMGSLFYSTGSGGGLYYPGESQNSYIASAMPVFAAISSTQARPVALGVFDHPALAGRPVPIAQRSGDSFSLRQQHWIAPGFNPSLNPNSVRALEVEQEVLARDDVEGVIVVRVTYTNISDTDLMRAYAPHMPAGPVTWTNAYIGYAIDADIGASGDDWVSYDPALHMVYTYDADFSENEFGGPSAGAPGLLGLRVLSAQADTDIQLNSWRSCPANQICSNAGDWAAGSISEQQGYGMLSGETVYAPAHADAGVGHLPPAPADLRMSVTAGPLTLAPGESAEIVIAVLVAPPAPGSFTSGVQVTPGDPFDVSRAIHQVAAPLRQRAIAAEGIAGGVQVRPR